MLSWLLLVALGMLWAAFLNPTKKASSPAESVRDFEIDMGRLAGDRDEFAALTSKALAAARARDRRRRFFTGLVAVAFGALILGAIPMLRWMWFVSGASFLMLAGFLWMLLAGRAAPRRGPRRAAPVPPAPRPRAKVPLADIPLDGSEGEIVVRRMPRAGGV